MSDWKIKPKALAQWPAMTRRHRVVEETAETVTVEYPDGMRDTVSRKWFTDTYEPAEPDTGAER